MRRSKAVGGMDLAHRPNTFWRRHTHRGRERSGAVRRLTPRDDSGMEPGDNLDGRFPGHFSRLRVPSPHRRRSQLGCSPLRACHDHLDDVADAGRKRPWQVIFLGSP